MKKFYLSIGLLASFFFVFPPAAAGVCSSCQTKSVVVENRATAIANSQEGDESAVARSIINTLQDQNRATPPGQYIRSQVQARQEIISENIATRQAQIRTRITAHQKERVQGFLARLTLRFKTANNHFARIIARIRSRVEKMGNKNPNLDKGAIEAQLDIAEKNLLLVEDSLINLEIELETLLDDLKPQEAFLEIKTAIKEMKGLLGEAKIACQTAVKLIKANS
ncbi:hypothetical protein ACFLZP_00685 [Patescibacteria group bacterium]